MKAAAETFRKNPNLDTERVILELKVGEALVSTLENKGEPSMVQRDADPPARGAHRPRHPRRAHQRHRIQPVYGKYEEAVDRESAHEMLAKRTEAAAQEANTGGGWEM